MQLFIPTRDRVNAQYTWDNLTPALRAITKLCVPEAEIQQHLDLGRNAVVRPPVKLAGVRQWIVSELADQTQPVIMMDDDLGFFNRRDPGAYNLQPISKHPDLNVLFQDLNDLVALEGYAHAGLSPRQGNNRLFPETRVYNTRINAVHCVNPAVLSKEGVAYDTVDMMEDYHVTLSLLERGYGNVALADRAWDQVKGSGAPGGFSHYRNRETQTAAANRLAELHPQFVTVVEKTPKTGSGDFSGTRTDVRIQWKKAYESSQNPPKVVAVEVAPVGNPTGVREN